MFVQESQRLTIENRPSKQTLSTGPAHHDRGLRREERGGGRAGELLRIRQGRRVGRRVPQRHCVRRPEGRRLRAGDCQGWN